MRDAWADAIRRTLARRQQDDDVCPEDVEVGDGEAGGLGAEIRAPKDDADNGGDAR